MAPGREFLSSHRDNLLFQLSRAGIDLFEQDLVRRTRRVKLDGPAQFFHRLGAGASTIGQPALQEMNPALHREDLTMKA
jgi:hypothetical protein